MSKSKKAYQYIIFITLSTTPLTLQAKSIEKNLRCYSFFEFYDDDNHETGTMYSDKELYLMPIFSPSTEQKYKVLIPKDSENQSLFNNFFFDLNLISASNHAASVWNEQSTGKTFTFIGSSADNFNYDELKLIDKDNCARYNINYSIIKFTNTPRPYRARARAMCDGEQFYIEVTNCFSTEGQKLFYNLI